MVGAYVRSSISLTIPPGADARVFATCDPGDIATGGGFTTEDGVETLDVFEARPEDPIEAPFAPTFYQVRAANHTSADRDLQAWVICLDVTP